MGFNATTTRSTAYATVKEVAKVPKLRVGFKQEAFNLWLRGLLRAASSIPRKGAPGDSGHAHLVLSEAALREFSGVDNAVNDEDATPGDYPTHAADATAAAIANANSLYERKSEKFYTQLGTKDGVRDLIVDTADPALLIELKHTIWDFSRQTPLELMNHV